MFVFLILQRLLLQVLIIFFIINIHQVSEAMSSQAAMIIIDVNTNIEKGSIWCQFIHFLDQVGNDLQMISFHSSDRYEHRQSVTNVVSILKQQSQNQLESGDEFKLQQMLKETLTVCVLVAIGIFGKVLQLSQKDSEFQHEMVDSVKTGLLTILKQLEQYGICLDQYVKWQLFHIQFGDLVNKFSGYFFENEARINSPQARKIIQNTSKIILNMKNDISNDVTEQLLENKIYFEGLKKENLIGNTHKLWQQFIRLYQIIFPLQKGGSELIKMLYYEKKQKCIRSEILQSHRALNHEDFYSQIHQPSLALFPKQKADNSTQSSDISILSYNDIFESQLQEVSKATLQEYRENQITMKHRLANLRPNYPWLASLSKQNRFKNTQSSQIQIMPNNDVLKQQSKEQTKEKSDQRFNKNHIHFLQEVIKILKERDIHVLSRYWQNGLMELLTELFSNWNIYKHQYQQCILTLAHLLDYKLAKFNLDFKSKDRHQITFYRGQIQDKKLQNQQTRDDQKPQSTIEKCNYNSQCNILEQLCPKIAYITQSLLMRLGQKDLWQIFNEDVIEHFEYLKKRLLQNKTKQKSLRLIVSKDEPFLLLEDQIVQLYQKQFNQKHKQQKQMPKEQVYKLMAMKINSCLGKFHKRIKKQVQKDIFQNKVLLLIQQYFKIFHKKFKQNLNMWNDNILDKVLICYLLQIGSHKMQKQFSVKLEETVKVPISKYLSEVHLFICDYPGLEDTLSVIESKVNQVNSAELQNQNEQKKKKIYFQTIINQRVLNTCIGCSQFFYDSFNIYDEQVSKVPVRVFPSVRQMREYEAQIKQQICAMLNSGGGVILFGCKQQYRSIIAKGERMTERQKEEYEQRVGHLIKCFSPRVEINTNVMITFVPMVENPCSSEEKPMKSCYYAGQEAIFKTGQTYYNRSYIKGNYVTRIRVCPSSDRFYVWQGECAKYYCSILQGKKTVQLKSNLIVKHLKRKFKRNNILGFNKLTSEEKILLALPKDCFQGQCLLPEPGHIITELDVQVPKSEKYEDKFNYVSMLVVRSQNIQKVKERLGTRNIQFKVERVDQRFGEINLKSSKGTAILYHNHSFDEVLKMISSNKDFMFEQKQVLAIYVTQYLQFTTGDMDEGPPIYQEWMKKDKKYLKMMFPISQKLMDQAQTFLNKKFCKEGIRYFVYVNQNKMYFFAQMQTKLSTLLMYYFFKEFVKKTLLKTPLNLTERSPEEQKKAWIQIENPFHNQNTLTIEEKSQMSQN